ncbi:hypothetical protein ACIPLC_30955 [Kitasatospora sp. NPDC086801]
MADAPKAHPCSLCGTKTADGKVIGVIDRVSGPSYVRWACRTPCAPPKTR